MILDNSGYERVDTDDLQVGDVVTIPVQLSDGSCKWIDSEIASIQKSEGIDQMSIRVWRNKDKGRQWTQAYTMMRHQSIDKRKP